MVGSNSIISSVSLASLAGCSLGLDAVLDIHFLNHHSEMLRSIVHLLPGFIRRYADLS